MNETGGKSVFHRPQPAERLAAQPSPVRRTQPPVRPVVAANQALNPWLIIWPLVGVAALLTLIAAPVVFLIAVPIGLVPAAIARSKGRSFAHWWVYGAALFIVALPHALVMQADIRGVEARLAGEGMKKCPACAEMIKADAAVCRYCSREVAGEES